MRKMLYVACLCLGMGARAQVKVGQPVPETAFTTLLNAPEKQLALSALRGKVVLLEFWATWCGPCIRQMPHLQDLQETFKDKLQIVAVTAEREDRIRQFLRNRPSSLWIAVDTARQFETLFPFRIIPHAVLIGIDGVVRAITDPAQVTEKVINDLIAGKTIVLPPKEDPPHPDPKSYVAQYFAATPQAASRVLIQPAAPGVGSFVDHYGNDPAFRNRRITVVNVPLLHIYQMAHGDVTVRRTINQMGERERSRILESYSLDIIVAKGEEQELLPTLAKELRERFGIHGQLEKQIKPVYVLQVADPNKVKQLLPEKPSEGYLMMQGDAFSGEMVPIRKLKEYLENFGIVDRPVVDETGLTATYNISIRFQPEQEESLMKALEKIGFRLTKAQKEIDVLVLR